MREREKKKERERERERERVKERESARKKEREREKQREMGGGGEGGRREGDRKTTIRQYHTFVSFILHNLICRSSAPLITKGKVGWNEAQLTPLSCPSRTYLTIASFPPERKNIWNKIYDLFI